MDMSWQAMLYEAAAVSFERNTETLAADDSTCFFATNIRADGGCTEGGATGSRGAEITMSILSDMNIWE